MSDAQALALAPVPENAVHKTATELAPGLTVNEVTVFLSTRNDRYVTIPVGVLETLTTMQVDQVLIQFKKSTPGVEVLSRVPYAKRHYQRQWACVWDKDNRRVYRLRKDGLVQVVWG